MNLRNYLLSGILAVSLIMTACGNKEPQQREKFIDILQTRVITPKGIYVPQLTDDERKQIGIYIDHFQILTDFHEAMDLRMSKMGDSIQKMSQIKPSTDPQENLESIIQVKNVINEMNTGLNEEFAKTKINKEALQQPDDLKAVFDQAFEKSLLKPVNAFNAMMNKVNEALDAQTKLYEFIQANKGKLDLSGQTIIINDESIQAQLQELMNEVNQKAAELTSTQADFDRAMRE